MNKRIELESLAVNGTPIEFDNAYIHAKLDHGGYITWSVRTSGNHFNIDVDNPTVRAIGTDGKEYSGKAVYQEPDHLLGAGPLQGLKE